MRGGALFAFSSPQRESDTAGAPVSLSARAPGDAQLARKAGCSMYKSHLPSLRGGFPAVVFGGRKPDPPLLCALRRTREAISLTGAIPFDQITPRMEQSRSPESRRLWAAPVHGDSSPREDTVLRASGRAERLCAVLGGCGSLSRFFPFWQTPFAEALFACIP